VAEQYVYFIQDVTGHVIKVGCAADPQSRLAQLKTGNPRKLRLLGYLPGGRKLEQEIHKELAYWRLDGEWFQREGVMEYIDKITPDRWAFLNPPPPNRRTGAKKRWNRFDRQEKRDREAAALAAQNL
jgi:hypothetical protein